MTIAENEAKFEVPNGGCWELESTALLPSVHRVRRRGLPGRIRARIRRRHGPIRRGVSRTSTRSE